MADEDNKKTTELPELVLPVVSDLLRAVSDVAGTPTDEKVTFGTVLNRNLTSAESAAGLTEANIDVRFETFNSKRYGALFDGSTDDSAAHQIALDVLERAGGGTWVIAAGTSRAQGLILRAENIRIACEGFIQPVTNTTASVLQIGVDATALVRELTGNINIGGLSQVASSWTNITGIDCKRMQECQLHVSVRGVGIGIACTAGTGGFVAYNNFFLGALVNNQIDISLNPTGTGAVNENKFYGGRFAQNSGTWSAGKININIADDGDNKVNHNTWFSPSFESLGRVTDWVGALDNHIIDARFEPPTTGTAGVDYDDVQLLMDADCQRNHIQFGGGDSWFNNSIDHGAGTRVNNTRFTVASTDVTEWFYPGAPMLLTIGGDIVFAYCESSSFSTDTTVEVFLPLVSGNPTVIDTARFKSGGDDNEISHNTLGIPMIDTLSFYSNPRSIINYGRSTLNIAAINADYPALNLTAPGSGAHFCWQVTNNSGVVAASVNGNGFGFNARWSVGDQATPSPSRTTVTDADTAHDLNVVYSDTEVESTLDALGTKINSILASLEAFGLHKSV